VVGLSGSWWFKEDAGASDRFSIRTENLAGDFEIGRFEDNRGQVFVFCAGFFRRQVQLGLDEAGGVDDHEIGGSRMSGRCAFGHLRRSWPTVRDFLPTTATALVTGWPSAS